MPTAGVGIGPSQQHVHADRGEAGDQRGLDHVAGQPRVLADHHAMAVLAALEDEAGRLPDLERELGRDHAIGAAANAVGAEILAHHDPAALCGQGRRFRSITPAIQELRLAEDIG